MKNNNIVIFILITLLTSSCFYSNRSFFLGNKYEMRSMIPDSVYTFLDDIDFNSKIHHVSYTVPWNYRNLPSDFLQSASILEVHEISSKDFLEFKTYIEDISIDKFSVSDKKYGIIMEPSELNEMLFQKKTLENMSVPYLLPYLDVDRVCSIPDIIKIDTSTYCNLPSEYNIYIIKSGCRSGDDNIFNNYKYLPDEYKHGYISAVAIRDDNNIVIFFAYIW